MKSQKDYRKIIANNLTFLLQIREINRKDLCLELDIKYTTLCDWLKGQTYPRLDTLEKVAGYFSLDLPDMFVDIPKDEKLVARLEAYMRRINMTKDYSDTYPDDFFTLFGAGNELNIEIPEDLPAEELEITL